MKRKIGRKNFKEVDLKKNYCFLTEDDHIVNGYRVRVCLHNRYTYRPGVAGARTNLTANRNCIAHTNKQHKFNDSDNAHNANVTS